MNIKRFETAFFPLLKNNPDIKIKQYNSKAYSNKTGNISVHEGEFDKDVFNYIYIDDIVYYINYNEDVILDKSIIRKDKKGIEKEVKFGLISSRYFEYMTGDIISNKLGYRKKEEKKEEIPYIQQLEMKYNEIEDRENKNNFKSITDNIASLLEYKNAKYGNSALEPLNIFKGKCKVGDTIDHKLARVKNSKELSKNDIVDITSYLILVCKENNWTNFDEFKD